MVGLVGLVRLTALLENTMNASIQKRLLKLAALPAIALGALAAGCNRGAESTEAEAAPVVMAVPAAAPSQSKMKEVGIDNFSYNPAVLTVSVGTTVTWVNHDDIPHTVTANDKRFASTGMDTDDKFSHVFTTPGTYSYFCMIHPHMTGQIIVK